MPVVGWEGEAPADLNHRCVPHCICCRTRFKMDTCFPAVRNCVQLLLTRASRCTLGRREPPPPVGNLVPISELDQQEVELV